jgi:hypothetical protein
MKTVRYTRTLFYYDGVQLFEARDAIGGNYVGVLLPESAEEDQYLVVGVSPEDLREFRAGAIDLRALLLRQEEAGWFVATPRGELTEPLEIVPQAGRLVDFPHLPAAGFVLKAAREDEALVGEAKRRGNLMFSLSVEPPEAAQGHRIHADTLGRLLTLMQRLVKHAYGAALRKLSPDALKSIDRSNAHLIDVVLPATAGSFRVVFEAARTPDLVGGHELSRAFERIDALFAASEDPAATLKAVKEARGHFAGSYIRLLQFLAETRTGLRYSWARPDFVRARAQGVAEAHTRPLVELLGSMASLGVETRTVVGVLTKVNTKTGTWGLHDEMTGDDVTGRRREDGPSLAGLVTEKQRYQFLCEEVAEEVQGTGREQRVLYVTAIEPA